MKPKGEKDFTEIDDRIDLILYRALIACMIGWILGFKFITEPTIGGRNYVLFVMLLPTILGVIAGAICRRAFLIRGVHAQEGFFQKVIYWSRQIVFSFVLGFVTLGLVAHIVWHYWNKNVAYTSPVESFYCEIREFHDGGEHTDEIYFTFQGQPESISVSYHSIKPYLNKDPDNYIFRVMAREGVWQHYIIEEASVERKDGA